MAKPVKIVTDSTSDIPSYAALELGIGVVPLTVKFGTEAFVDGIEIDANDFYDRLMESYKTPSTAAPSPGQFLEEYDKAGREGKDVLSLHISAKLSGTYDAALLAKGQSKSTVEAIDTQSATMGLGLIAIWAAKHARKGAELKTLVEETRKVLSRVRVVGLVDTLEYLQKGGRIGKAQAFLGSILNIKPLLCVRDGEAFPLERVRTKSKALERMWEICRADAPYEELSILHSTNPEEAENMLARFTTIYPRERIYKARFGPILGAHLGPGSLGVAYIKSK